VRKLSVFSVQLSVKAKTEKAGFPSTYLQFVKIIDISPETCGVLKFCK